MLVFSPLWKMGNLHLSRITSFFIEIDLGKAQERASWLESWPAHLCYLSHFLWPVSKVHLLGFSPLMCSPQFHICIIYIHVNYLSPLAVVKPLLSHSPWIMILSPQTQPFVCRPHPILDHIGNPLLLGNDGHSSCGSLSVEPSFCAVDISTAGSWARKEIPG